MKNLKWSTMGISTALLVGMTACVTPQIGYETDQEYHLTILHTNDHHGRFWKNSRGEYGMAARKTLIDSIRTEVEAKGGEVLLLSGGDINTGVPESDLLDAEPDFLAMNLLGYDAMAVGNHEFDNPMDVLLQQQDWANFPFLSANIFFKESGETVFEPYDVIKVANHNIGIVGFTTEDTVKVVNPTFVENLEFKQPVEVAQEIIPELAEQTDLIIAVTHMGHYPNAEFGGNAPGDVTLARSVSGIDVIVGGHSQVPLFEPDVQNGTLIVQAHEWGKYVGRLDLTLKNGEITAYDYRLIPVNLKDKVKDEEGNSQYILREPLIVEDPAVLEFLTPYQEKGADALNRVIGRAEGDFVGEREIIRNQPSNLGVLIAKAQMEKVHADVAVMNSGGIRSSIEAGDITYKTVLSVQPFANIISMVELTGSELMDYLSVAIAKEAGTGAFAQFYGVDIIATDGVINSADINGRPISYDRTYRLAVNSFIASGGDGYPSLVDHPNFVDTGFVDADVLVEYIVKKGVLNANDYDPGLAIDRM